VGRPVIRTGVTALLLIVASALAGYPALAAQPGYTSRPIRLIVAQSAGGSADFVARTYTQRIAELLGQQFVIDNRPGGAGIVGTELVVNALPDGYTLLLAPTSHAINPNFVARLPYDTRRDLASISLLGAGYNLLVINQNNAARTLADIIGAARAQPGKLRYASSGVAGATHLTTELFRLMAGIDLLHVPYKGAPAALTAVIGNECDFSFGSMASALPLVRANRLRALAITSRERWPGLPEIPTVAEAGVAGYESSSWQALFGPAKLPREIIDRIYRAVAQSAKNPDLVKRFNAEGMVPLGTNPRELDEHIARELEKWVKVTKAAGLNVH
jgi:tripartite-type tricarboxylate transporter receptor subunit TctC